jgi:DNA replication and repair protein RecF
VAHIQRLTLTAFRNYDRLRLETGPGCIVVTGPNGAGKTNLLEAISLLAPGRGMRNARLSDMGKADSGASWGVAATLATGRGALDLGTGAEAGSERRVVRIEGVNRNQSALSDAASILWLTPSMDRLFAEPASTRRKFVDRIVFGFDASHATRVNRYEQALRERQKLLEEQRHPAWLDGIETVLCETGVAIAAARLHVVARLDTACARQPGPFPCPALAMTGPLETWLASEPALAVEERFRAALADNRAQDRAAGRSLLGAHRSDLAARYRDRDIDAGLCSTGEQKGLLISIILANVALMAGENAGLPIVLLDEIGAHLDAARRDVLFERIASLGIQAWMSGTERDVFSRLDGVARYLTVHDGCVSG